jgi:type IV secretory pathway VirB2 component (pilin)
MHTYFIIISTVLALISPVVYCIAILKGEAKPHRTTRFVFLIISTLTTASLVVQGNTTAVWLAGASFLQSIVIFILSIKRGMGGWAKSDIVCLLAALFGIGMWKVTQSPVLALYFAIGADFIGMLPALIKTYHFPKTEVWTFYLLDVFAACFSLLALKQWTVGEYSYPAYIVFINLAMVVLIMRPQKT